MVKNLTAYFFSPLPAHSKFCPPLRTIITDAVSSLLILLAPISAYRHNRTGEDNADAHLKRQIMGREIMVAITTGQLDLKARPLLRIRYGGPWE